MVEKRDMPPRGAGFGVCGGDGRGKIKSLGFLSSPISHGLDENVIAEEFSAAFFGKERGYCVSWPLAVSPTDFFAKVKVLISRIERGVGVGQRVEGKSFEWEIICRGEHSCIPAEQLVSFETLKREYPNAEVSAVRFNSRCGDFIFQRSIRGEAVSTAYLVTRMSMPREFSRLITETYNGILSAAVIELTLDHMDRQMVRE